MLSSRYCSVGTTETSSFSKSFIYSHSRKFSSSGSFCRKCLISILGELLCHQAKLIECSSHSLVPLPCLPFPTNHTLLSLLVSCQLCLFECCWLMGWSVFPPWECCFWLCFWSAPVFPVLSSTYDTHGCAVKKYCSTLEATVNQDHYWFTHYIFTMTLHCNVLCRLHRTAPGLLVYWCSCPVDTLLYLYCAWCLYPNVLQYYANCGTLLYHWMTWCIVYRQAGAFLVVTLHLLLRMLVLPCFLSLTSSHCCAFLNRRHVTSVVLLNLLCFDGIITSSCLRASIECVRQSVT